MIYQKPFMVVLFALILQVNSYKYFIHDSCSASTVVQEAINEAINLAEIANARLQTMIGRINRTPVSLPDQNDRRTFRIIFGTDIDDTIVRDKVLGITEGVRGYTRTGNQASAHVRYYCDNDAKERFKVTEDIHSTRHGRPKTTINSQRPAATQEWEDVENGIRWFGPPRECLSMVNGAYTTHPKTMISGSHYAHHVRPRAVTTFCGNILERGLPTIADRGEADMDGVMIEIYNTYASMLILHELLHATPANTEDYVITPANPYADPPVKAFKAYGWNPLLALNRESAFVNDDSFGYWILWTNLAFKGYRLSKDDSEVTTGEICWDEDIIPDPSGPIPAAIDVDQYDRLPPAAAAPHDNLQATPASPQMPS